MTTETFTTAGTSSWTCPTGVTSIQIECWGAGGGGSGGDGTYVGSGGGAGAYAKKNTFSVTPGNSYTYVIGAGGSGGANGIAAGHGTQTYFNSTGTVKAAPGAAPTGLGGGLRGTAGSSVGDVCYDGGSGGTGNLVKYGAAGGGGGGGSGGTGSNGNHGDLSGSNGTLGAIGGAAVTGGGGGGNGGDDPDGNAVAGSAPGGGGGGGAGGSSGGDGGFGADGQIILTYTASGGTFTGTSAVSVHGATISGSATFTKPTFTGASTVISGGASLSGVSTFVAPSTPSPEVSNPPEESNPPTNNELFLQDLTNRIGKRTAGYNTSWFIELDGGSLVAPTAFEPDATTHRGDHYYNAMTNTLYRKIVTRNKGGIITAYWKKISD